MNPLPGWHIREPPRPVWNKAFSFRPEGGQGAGLLAAKAGSTDIPKTEFKIDRSFSRAPLESSNYLRELMAYAKVQTSNRSSRRRCAMRPN